MARRRTGSSSSHNSSYSSLEDWGHAICACRGLAMLLYLLMIWESAFLLQHQSSNRKNHPTSKKVSIGINLLTRISNVSFWSNLRQGNPELSSLIPEKQHSSPFLGRSSLSLGAEFDLVFQWFVLQRRRTCPISIMPSRVLPVSQPGDSPANVNTA